MIRSKAEAQIGHSPEDKSIVVMYESDKNNFMQGSDKNLLESNNIIVEIPTPRPSWFSGNLLQKSTLRVNPDAKSISPHAPVPMISDESKKES